jgi:pimeloyl-ACP methyl ester carboxylesterase
VFLLIAICLKQIAILLSDRLGNIFRTLPMLSAAITTAAQALTESNSIAQFDQMKFQVISSQGQEVLTNYICQGNGGTPILLLHGFDSSVLEWRRLQPLLAEGQETWAVDLLGFGFSERSTGLTFSPASICEHLYSFWQRMIQKPMLVVGASMGGAAAIDFTLKYPAAVEKLVLIDSAGLQQPPKIGMLMFPPLDRLATSFLSNPKIRQSISKAAYCDQTWASEDARVCAALHLQCDRWQEALIGFTKNGGYGNFGNQLSQISQSVLILWGRQDQILGVKDADRFQQLLPQSKLVWVENCGHVPHLEQPQVTAELMRGF